ncbi:hypothetical protein J6590_072689 [Homalodisca vitripennis]|nr:hypothetical protein J6590_072689 [Homalodisca vitripennis]
MDDQERHITNRKCRDSGGFFHKCQRFMLARHKGVPPSACFDWRGWFTAGCLKLFLMGLDIRWLLTPNLSYPEYPVIPKAAQRSLWTRLRISVGCFTFVLQGQYPGEPLIATRWSV